jgi:anti-sigma factor RsiW
MNRPGTGDGHVQLWLGVYLLGALATDEYVAVDRHLAICQGCRIECDELRAASAFLAKLSAADVDAMTDEFRAGVGATGARLSYGGRVRLWCAACGVKGHVGVPTGGHLVVDSPGTRRRHTGASIVTRTPGSCGC